MKWSNIKELLMHILFFLTACVSIFAVVLICVFLFANGIPAIGKIGVFKFLLGTKWKPGNDIYGILPMILGSLYVTAGAIIIGVPIGLLTAVFLAKFCPKGLYKILKPATELMAGVPSVVYGFFGLVVLVPLVQTFRRSGQHDADSVRFARHYDLADNHRRFGKCHSRRAGQLL